MFSWQLISTLYQKNYLPLFHRWIWAVVLEKTLESPLDYKEIKPANPKGDQSWMFIRRTDAKAPILWPPDAKSWHIRKDPDAVKDWRQEEKEMTEDEMVGWHHGLNGHEFQQALGDGEGQRSLVWCSPWGCRASTSTELLNNNFITTYSLGFYLLLYFGTYSSVFSFCLIF